MQTRLMTKTFAVGVLLSWVESAAAADSGSLQKPTHSPGAVASLVSATPLTEQAELGRLSTAQWDRFLLREIEQGREQRRLRWNRDLSSREAYEQSIAPNRERFRSYIGLRDERVTGSLEITRSWGQTGPLAVTSRYTVEAIRWPVLEGVNGEGLVLRPRGETKAVAIVVPDADQSPELLVGLHPGLDEKSQLPRRLAESGVLVVVPVLLGRESTHSGDTRLRKYTDQSHREWIYRQSAELGRHVIGFEVQKILALVDHFRRADEVATARPPMGIAGYGEGGLLALYAAAVDPRVDAAWVSGYFQPRERVWTEPLYRSVWGLLEEFGDAEIASMVGGRALVVEYCRGPEIPRSQEMPAWPAKPNSVTAAPGMLTTPEPADVKAEWDRTLTLVGGNLSRNFTFAGGPGPGQPPFSHRAAVDAFLHHLKTAQSESALLPLEQVVAPAKSALAERQHRTFRELQEFTQAQARLAEYARETFFWSKLKPDSAASWARQVEPMREAFYNDVIGRLPTPTTPLNARSRVVPKFSSETWTTHEVVLDVYPGVITWGWLLLPNDINAGERRPVVVCQHGAGASPHSTVATAPDPDYPYYQAFAAKLAARGFVVFSPYNPNTGTGEAFRQLQRKANLLRTSVFSIITLNHATILKWLKEQPFVDPQRIGFYGLSYGGKTAMRVPAILKDYCLSICSGDFNDYVPKMTSVRSDKGSFMFSYPYETIEFNLANTFNYAEMAALIAPRPFMVEHGYLDRVAPLEWAAAEYSKVQRLYFRLGIPALTTIDYFEGPHMIHGVKTFQFLHEHLGWPEPPTAKAASDAKAVR